MSSTVLVTGASGYIGRRLVNSLLGAGVKVRILTRDRARIQALWPADEVQVMCAELSRATSLDGVCANVESIFHLAGGETETPVSDDQVLNSDTIAGIRALLAGAVTHGVRKFIFMSSVKAMGEGGAACLDETSPPMPVSLYGRAKYAAEALVIEAGRRHGLHVCNLRLPMVYGGADRKGNLPRMIAAIDRGRFPPLPELGNKRSMVHVDDAVRAALLISEQPRANGETYIVTDGRYYSTREIYQAIRSALGKPLAHWSLPMCCWRTAARLGDWLGHGFPLNSKVLTKLTDSAWYSSEKIRRELGYRSTHTLFDALPEMVAHYRQTRP